MRNVYCCCCCCSALLILVLLVCVRADTAATQVCPIGWRMGPHMNKCFMHLPESHSWEQSETLCQDHCTASHLAALTSSQELIFARTLCPAQDACWLSGSFNSSSYNHTGGADSCTLLTRSTLRAETCNSPHQLLCMIDIGHKCHHKGRHKEYFIILSVISVFILCTTLVVVIWLLAHKRTKRRRRSHKVSNPSTSSLVQPSWKVFTNEQLRSITKNFSEGNRLLGDAKTGGTYSGVLLDGSKVAVKRLKRSNFQRKKEFYSEIGRVARLHHPNLVALKGCCYDNGDRYIVYEFVANGPLDRWLHHIPRGGRCLNWSMRMRVATTLAQGIAYVQTSLLLAALNSYSLL